VRISESLGIVLLDVAIMNEGRRNVTVETEASNLLQKKVARNNSEWHPSLEKLREG